MVSAGSCWFLRASLAPSLGLCFLSCKMVGLDRVISQDSSGAEFCASVAGDGPFPFRPKASGEEH